MEKLIFILGTLLFSINSGHAIEINNFKSGLVCGDTVASGWICHESKKIHITGQGRCTYNGELNPCTWYGFEFDYKNHEEDDVIKCQYKVSQSLSLGNPKEEIEKSLTEQEFELTVPHGEGHFYNPQYSVLSVRTYDSHLVQEETSCSFEDKLLFKYEREYVYPTNP